MGRKITDIQADIKANRGLYISLQQINPCKMNKDNYLTQHMELQRELDQTIKDNNKHKEYFAIVGDKERLIPPPSIDEAKLAQVRKLRTIELTAMANRILA